MSSIIPQIACKYFLYLKNKIIIIIINKLLKKIKIKKSYF